MARNPRAVLVALPALALATALASPLVASSASAAGARDLGGVQWSQTKGNGVSLPTLYSERGCPADAVYVRAMLFGKGMPERGQSIVAPTKLLVSRTQPMGLPVSNAFVIYAEQAGTALQGEYDVKVQCVDKTGARPLGEFSTSMTWRTPGGTVKNAHEATYVAKSTAEVDVASVFVPNSDPLGGMPLQPEDGVAPAQPAPASPAPATTAAPGTMDAPTTSNAPTTAVPTNEPTAAAAPTTTDLAAAPATSDGGSDRAPLLWLGVGAIALVSALAFWLLPGRSSRT